MPGERRRAGFRDRSRPEIGPGMTTPAWSWSVHLPSGLGIRIIRRIRSIRHDIVREAGSIESGRTSSERDGRSGSTSRAGGYPTLGAANVGAATSATAPDNRYAAGSRSGAIGVGWSASVSVPAVSARRIGSSISSHAAVISPPT